MKSNTTYQKIAEIDHYMSGLRKEFPGAGTVGEMLAVASRATLERKYAELLLLSQQLTRTSEYTLGRI